MTQIPHLNPLSPNMIELKHLADDGYMCVDSRDIFKLKGGKTFSVYHRDLGNIGKAKICQITIEGSDKTYLADTVTGTLYDVETLKCLSSDALSLKS